ncbi:Uncharacterized protein FWK35_00022180 [Aphis craccivora]|uniref:Uncharacterized protein n=1 Tax=Aphis craccivora TaxID=307492 RepID=A0A6G0XZR1_APHCR|nr:Uncharacterized protein FWK35_00022180 [Aphis craccivora]
MKRINIENYSEEVENMVFSETGVYKESIMNAIYSFHVTKNYCVDIMHDLFEDVCRYDMCHIIKYFINTIQVFSLETLNSRKTREMMTFVHFFSLMVGDLVPEGDEVWNFF